MIDNLIKPCIDVHYMYGIYMYVFFTFAFVCLELIFKIELENFRLVPTLVTSKIEKLSNYFQFF